MADTEEDNQATFPPNPINGQEPQDFSNGDKEDDDYEDGDDDDKDEEEEGDDDDDLQEPNLRKPQSRESVLLEQRFKINHLVQRLRSEEVPIRVHDVIIKGNTKTKDWIIEAELQEIRNAKTMQELLKTTQIALAKLKKLGIFDSGTVTLEAGPPEFGDVANVIVHVSEAKSNISAELSAYGKPSASSWVAEGALKYKNLLGYGDIWDGSLAYGANGTSEVSVGLLAPRVKGFVTPAVVRVSLLSQDWQEFCSYKERSLGMSLGLFSTKHHDLVYNLGWRTLTDPSQMSSRSIRRQLGHGLLSSLKYTFKIDRRNSSIRPTKGYAFLSTTQLGGLTPDIRSLRFLRQEFDVRYALPFGFYKSALNLGMSAGVVFPWGCGFLNKPSPLPEKFFLGGDFSPVCTLGGPTTIWGFKTRGLGPTEPRRENRDDNDDDAYEMDFIGGDLAVTAFADLSFDLPVRWFRERGIHGHVFASAGNIAKLTENEYRHFSPRKFLESFRMSVGCGIVIPTRLFRIEGNFYHGLRQHEHDRARTGFRLNLSAPS
ncbi:sorting and assembly machinery component 50-like protein [Senna tora]|uniref:Sorting and assembly machinery component 50-like protein n=1 Tax=Senna tora TaxID=362788 RepID=A0A834T726_9FABA|nr:sorting and assembly machinery component 50-like protein [Senna tora]